MEALFFAAAAVVIIVALVLASRHARNSDAPRVSGKSSSNSGLDLLFTLVLFFFLIPALLSKGKKGAFVR